MNQDNFAKVNNSNDDNNEKTRDTIMDPYRSKLEKMRWLVLFVFSYTTFASMICWDTFSGILTQAETYYDITEQEALLFGNAFMYFQFAFCIFIVYLYEIRPKESLIVACCFNCIGSWGRYISKDNYIAAILFQFSIVPSMCFVLSTQVYMADNWFHESEKFLAINIGCYSNFFGIAVGYFLSPLIIGNDETEIPKLLLIEAIIASIPMLFVFFLKSKPKEFPSISASSEKYPYFKSLKILIQDKEY